MPGLFLVCDVGGRQRCCEELGIHEIYFETSDEYFRFAMVDYDFGEEWLCFRDFIIWLGLPLGAVASLLFRGEVVLLSLFEALFGK